MKPSANLLAGLLVVLSVLLAGCTSDSGTAPETPVPVTTATPEPTTQAPTPTPTPTPTSPADVPIDVPPPAQAVTLELTKNRPTSELHLLYQGGPGIQFTQKIVMWVYNEDGSYQEYLMSNGKRPVAGDEIVAKGTRGGDRCVVFVTSGGVVYKVIDKKMYSDI
ncbi:hypothetical protein [Methanoregula sp.]|uniref:hypothetical protein n=1 Tax=Methanoregula sp. TaxID=2052170 RepID=UPI00260596B3|nr:hypothetical protein [Methanoregula sp.]MDD5143695.1 hypothetical protein [Methanoregula sp.]